MRIDIDVKEVTENCYVPKECKDGLREVVENGNLEDYAIRKLTPMECWRLMGFSDEDFLAAKVGSRTKADELLTEYKGDNVAMMDAADKIKQVSNSQLYKQAGNSIVVDVLYYIYKELYKAMPYLFEDLKVGSYFSGIGAFEKGLDRLFDNPNGANSNKYIGGGIKTIVVYDDYNNRLRAEKDNIGTLTTNIGVSALSNGYKLIEKVDTL